MRPPSRTVCYLCMCAPAVLASDGSITFVDLHAARFTAALRLSSPGSRACCFSMDARANSMAVVCSDGLARVYDLAAVRRGAQQHSSPAQQVQRLEEAQLQQLPAGAGVLVTSSRTGNKVGASTDVLRAPVAVLSDVVNVPAKAAGQAAKAAKQRSKDASGNSSGKAQAGLAVPGQLRVSALDAPAVALNKRKLQDMLSAYGEFPARYRQLIW